MEIIEVIKNTIGGLNLWQIISGILAGVLITKFIDEIILQIIGKYYPEKYLNRVYSWVKEFDDKYIDNMKKKYPKSAKEIENRIASFLRKCEDIILDK